MSAMTAYCGLLCQTCPIYLATREKNRAEQTRMRVEIARMCKEQYGSNYEPDDVNDCDGCRTESGRLFSGCINCSIRACAMQKTLDNCGYCDDYACRKLLNLFAAEPAARTRLDEIRLVKNVNSKVIGA